MVVRNVQMFLGLAPDGEDAPWGPLRAVTHLCGLTLQGGVEEDRGGPAIGTEAQQPARNREHLKLVTGHGRAP